MIASYHARAGAPTRALSARLQRKCGEPGGRRTRFERVRRSGRAFRAFGCRFFRSTVAERPAARRRWQCRFFGLSESAQATDSRRVRRGDERCARRFFAGGCGLPPLHGAARLLVATLDAARRARRAVEPRPARHRPELARTRRAKARHLAVSSRLGRLLSVEHARVHAGARLSAATKHALRARRHGRRTRLEW